LRGLDLAIVSGIAAARAIISAQSSTEVGPNYVQQLEKINLTPTLKLFAGWPEITSIPRMASAYPQLANDALKFMFTVDGSVPEKMPKAMMKIAKKHVSIGQLLADGWKGVTSI